MMKSEVEQVWEIVDKLNERFEEFETPFHIIGKATMILFIQSAIKDERTLDEMILTLAASWPLIKEEMEK